MCADMFSAQKVGFIQFWNIDSFHGNAFMCSDQCSSIDPEAETKLQAYSVLTMIAFKKVPVFCWRLCLGVAMIFNRGESGCKICAKLMRKYYQLGQGSVITDKL